MVPVITAAQQFYNGTTSIPVNRKDAASPKRVTKTLNMITNPEEKRKVIGDMFMRVADDVCMELNLRPEDTILAQGKVKGHNMITNPEEKYIKCF